MGGVVRVRAGGISPGEVAEVRRLAERAAAVDGVEPLGEQTLLDLVDSRAVHALADDGELVGYGQLGPRHGEARTIELVVTPDSRRRGLGAALLDSLLAAVADGTTTDSSPVRLWAHGSLPAARALAQRRGLVPVRELWRMSTELPTGPTAEPEALPLGATLRPFEPGRDEQAWLAANSAAFAHHPEQGGLTRADLDARTAESWFDPADLLLAEGPDGLLGFAWTKLAPPEGEVYALGVVPVAQGAGLGGALTRTALAHLQARGACRAVLFTDADNAAAVRTYVAAGFATDRVDTQYELVPLAGPRPSR